MGLDPRRVTPRHRASCPAARACTIA
jgi:hypothetical protein